MAPEVRRFRETRKKKTNFFAAAQKETLRAWKVLATLTEGDVIETKFEDMIDSEGRQPFKGCDGRQERWGGNWRETWCTSQELQYFVMRDQLRGKLGADSVYPEVVDKRLWVVSSSPSQTFELGTVEQCLEPSPSLFVLVWFCVLRYSLAMLPRLVLNSQSSCISLPAQSTNST